MSSGWFGVFVSACSLGVVLPMFYVVFLVATEGYAWLVEPNLFIIYGELVFMGLLGVLCSVKLFLDVRSYGKSLGLKDKWLSEREGFYK